MLSHASTGPLSDASDLLAASLQKFTRDLNDLKDVAEATAASGINVAKELDLVVDDSTIPKIPLRNDDICDDYPEVCVNLMCQCSSQSLKGAAKVYSVAGTSTEAVATCKLPALYIPNTPWGSTLTKSGIQ